MILGAAIVDDILAIAALSVVVTMVQTGNTEPAILDITLLIMQVLGTFAVILIVSVMVIPRASSHRKIVEIQREFGRDSDSWHFFRLLERAAFVGLSPIQESLR